MKCRWDRETKDYLVDDKPCRWDDYGDPAKHCTAKRGCTNHIGPNELTCARCLGRTRAAIRRIAELAPLMLPLALGEGVNSEAASLAGPGADYETFSARRRIDKRWIETFIPERNRLRAMVNLLADDDEHHPYDVLTRWEFMLREDYSDPRKDPTSVTSAAAYLDRVLHRVAQDDEQDFPLLAREMRTCRNHMESVLRNSHMPERGAPCPACAEAGEKAPRLRREYGHWCGEEDCEQLHYSTLLDHETGEDVPDTHGDWWSCPRNKAHAWSHEDYRRWVDDWADTTRSAAGTTAM